MPIKDKTRYPREWPAISRRIRERDGQRCRFCGAENGQPNPATGSRVVLTVAHLDHTPENCADDNLVALCQKCHLTYDARFHAANAKATRLAKKAQAADEAGQLAMWEC